MGRIPFSSKKNQPAPLFVEWVDFATATVFGWVLLLRAGVGFFVSWTFY
jgi:hypothetical protein